MELYNKVLIKDEYEALNLIYEWEQNKWLSFIRLEDFKKYPALVCYYDDENDYSMSHLAKVYYSITYLDDFEEK